MSSQKSYQAILKSSSLIGGAEVVKLIIGMVTVKFVAIYLGPAGIGLVGMYNSILNLVSRIASLGIGASGVREVAEAFGSEDNEKIGRTVLTLRRVCWLTGTAGSLIIVFGAHSISRLTFGDTEHAGSLVVLAWIILLRNVQTAQMAYLQGARRVGDLARLKIIGAAGGAVIGVGFYAWLRLDGIVPALLALAVFNLAISWWYAGKIPPPRVIMSWADSIRASKKLVRLGLAFMWTGLLTALVAYATRLMIISELDIEAVGIFQSSFRLSGIFVNFVLMAMGTDFYPRLTAIADDNKKVTRLVNEQTEIGLLLAVPGMLGIMVLAPWIIQIFYTSQFSAAAELLQWFVLGCIGRVISWPMGFILVAKGSVRWVILTETSVNIIHIALIWLGLSIFGITGVAIAFFVLYVIYIAMMLIISHFLYQFSWDMGVRKILYKMIPVIVVVFLLKIFLSEPLSSIAGAFITFLVSIYCLYGIMDRVGPDHKISKMVSSIPFFKVIVPRKP